MKFLGQPGTIAAMSTAGVGWQPCRQPRHRSVAVSGMLLSLPASIKHYPRVSPITLPRREGWGAAEPVVPPRAVGAERRGGCVRQAGRMARAELVLLLTL